MAWGDRTAVWSEAQLLTAARIIHQVRFHGGTDQACDTALAVALVESECLCLSSDLNPASKNSQWVQGNAPGDHQSVGCMQQQDSWGSTDHRMNPYGAAQRFLTGGDHGEPGLYDIPRWAALSLGDAATRVQRNATGSGPYARRAADAGRLRSLLSTR